MSFERLDSAEQGLPSYQSRLEFAASNAPPLRLTRVANTGYTSVAENSKDAAVEVLKGMPDKTSVMLGEIPDAPNEISVGNLEAYLTLLQQTAEFLSSLDAATWPAETAEHEESHAAAAREVNPPVNIRFLVSLFRAGFDNGDETHLVAEPSVIVLGRLRKIDIGRIFAAPAELSSQDSAMLEALGYKSAEDVKARLEKMKMRRELASGKFIIKRLIRIKNN